MSNENIDKVIVDLQTINKNLHRRLQNLSDEDKTSLYAYATQFDADASGSLDAHQVENAAVILRQIRHIDSQSLRLLNDILHLVDFNHNGAADKNEVALVLDILNRFAGDVEGDDNTLNFEELQHAYKAIKSFDRNDNGALNKEERGVLTSALKKPDYFKSFGE